MVTSVGDWVGEVSTTTGTGNITLGGPMPGFTSFESIGDPNGVGNQNTFYYAVVDGDNREAGICTISGNILVRTTIHATIVDGVYNDIGPTPINLSGEVEVYSTLNKKAFDDLLLLNGDLQIWRTEGLAARDAAQLAATQAQTSETNSANSATASQTSATASSASATAAEVSRTNAANSATTAEGHATAASTSAAEADTSATSAQTSATNAAAILANFEDIYHGALATPPATAQAGDLYFDTALSNMQVYNGTEWINAASVIEGIRAMFEYDVTSNSPTLSGLDNNSTTLVFDSPLSINVYRNGVRLAREHFTADSVAGTVSVPSAVVDDFIEIEVFGNFENSALDVLDGRYAEYGRPRKNLIINGGFRINQRGGTSSAFTYGIDRWKIGFFGMGVTCNTAPNTYSLSRNHGTVTISTAKASLAVDYYIHLYQIVEGFDAAHLRWGTPDAKPVTLSFKTFAAGFSGLISVALRDSGAQLSYVTTVFVDSTVREHEVVIPGPTAGTFYTDNRRCFDVEFTMAGSQSGQFTTPSPDSWALGNFFVAPTQVNGAATVNNRLEISDVQLEVGESATEIEFRPYTQELALCQRYYEVGRAAALLVGFNNINGFSTPFKVTKRVGPSTGISTIIYKNTGSSDPFVQTASPEFLFIRQATPNGTIDWTVIWFADAEL